MPLYRVTLELEAYVWSEQTSRSDVEEEIINQHAHDILNDQGPFDADINVRRINKIEEVTEDWRDGIAYGDEEERPIKELLVKPND